MRVTVHGAFRAGRVSCAPPLGIVRAVWANGESSGGVLMRAIPFVLQSALALVAVVPLARAQNVSINATITGEIVPGVYGRVVLGNRARRPPHRRQGHGGDGGEVSNRSSRAAGFARRAASYSPQCASSGCGPGTGPSSLRHGASNAAKYANARALVAGNRRRSSR